MIKADYSQIELRLAALIAQDRTLLAAYRTGQDVHVATAARLLGTAPEAVTPEARQLAKAVNFGLMYGMGAARLQSHAQQAYRVTMTLEEAADYKQRFFATYRGLDRWHRKTGAMEPTETRTLAGRRRLAMSKFTDRLNSPVQGTGADGMKWALARLFAHRDEAPDARLVVVVHDELVAECPIEAAEQTAVWLRTHMQAAMTELVQEKVPIEVEVTLGRDWAGTPLP